ncbi:MAG: hypothetical protein MMC33_002458 [Icmadophila ericetorum]|nr:hypothetical protein [Icmadophila ericetorum]
MSEDVPPNDEMVNMSIVPPIQLAPILDPIEQYIVQTPTSTTPAPVQIQIAPKIEAQDTPMIDAAPSPLPQQISTPTAARTATPTRHTNGVVEASTPMPSKAVPHGAQARRYLNEKVTGVLLEGMKRLAVEQPEDPLRVLGEYLLQRSRELEGGNGGS